METTFERAVIGDRVWSAIHGWGEFEGFTNDSNYPTSVRFGGNFGTAGFTLGGSYLLGGPQVLFWDEVKIVPPPRPKRKVKKKTVINGTFDWYFYHNVPSVDLTSRNIQIAGEKPPNDCYGELTFEWEEEE